ncbi:MAG: hypothetical protein M3R57_03205, partial [Chloroflexota bacterium]|nr:hypothetical protein [Chloroflexota bacterium]
MPSARSSRSRRAAAVVGAVVMLSTVVPTAAAASPFDTSQASMLEAVPPNGTVDPLITVGDRIGTYMFDAIPDGIAVRPGAAGTVQVFVNHETSTVPFPYTPGSIVVEGNQNDFGSSKVSRLILSRAGHPKIRGATMVITSQGGFQRLCSNFLATAAQGFSRELLLTNEEGVDWVNRSGPAWPATEGADNARQIGVVVAYDPRTNQRRPIWGMGRLNHENSLAVPGYGKPVVLTGDDTFVTTPS